MKMKKHGKLTTGLAAFAAFAAVGATPAVSHAQGVKEAPDDSWVSVSGTVTSTSPDAFKLDYKGGVITVAMDDFDFFAEGRQLMTNDEVVVYGKVDDDLFEKRTIEASSVYVENLNTHFYASAADEEDFYTWTVSGPVIVGDVEVTGIVTSITGREFVVDTGLSRIEVDTDEMSYNPLDDAGYFQIDVGDRVKVHGEIEKELFDNHELVADWITEYSL